MASYTLTEADGRLLEKHKCRVHAVAIAGTTDSRAFVAWTPTGERLHTADGKSEQHAINAVLSKLRSAPPGARVTVASTEFDELDKRRAEAEAENASLKAKLAALEAKENSKPPKGRSKSGDGETPKPEPAQK